MAYAGITKEIAERINYYRSLKTKSENRKTTVNTQLQFDFN